MKIERGESIRDYALRAVGGTGFLAIATTSNGIMLAVASWKVPTQLLGMFGRQLGMFAFLVDASLAWRASCGLRPATGAGGGAPIRGLAGWVGWCRSSRIPAPPPTLRCHSLL